MIIDTNVYSALDRGEATAVDAIRGQASLDVPLNVIAELHYGFLNGTRVAENKARLSRFLAQDGVRVLEPTLVTANIYAQLALHCRQVGRAVSNNDIWIAALAHENEAPLITFDVDFVVFSDLMPGKVQILR